MISGVYVITNSVSAKVYVGSSKDIDARFKRHMRELEEGRHHNSRMQNDFNIYGPKVFSMSLLEEIESDLKNREDFYIKELDAKASGYNIASANFGDTKTYHPNRQDIIDRTKETIRSNYKAMGEEGRREKFGRPGELNPNYNSDIRHHCVVCGSQLSRSSISRRANNCGDCRDRTGQNNPFYGKTHSEATKKKLREATTGKRRTSQGVEAEGMVFEAGVDCAKHFGISPALVTYRIKSPKYPSWNRVNAERPSKG